jgi:small subunit ribosomal protein S13
LAKEEENKDKENPKGQQHEQKKASTSSIVRIAGKDIDGELDIPSALRQIKGIGYNLSRALSLGIRDTFGIPINTTIGSLDEAKMLQVESMIKDPRKANIPLYILNRRKDRETGEDLHLVGTDLIVKNRQDIENDIKIQTYRGFRHRYGQKVRGQRNRSTGRTGATVGVTKSKVEAAAKAAKAPSGGGGAGAPAGEKSAAPAAAAPAGGEAKK